MISDIPAGDGKTANSFLQCILCKKSKQEDKEQTDPPKTRQKGRYLGGLMREKGKQADKQQVAKECTQAIRAIERLCNMHASR